MTAKYPDTVTAEDIAAVERGRREHAEGRTVTTAQLIAIADLHDSGVPEREAYDRVLGPGDPMLKCQGVATERQTPGEHNDTRRTL